MAETLHLSFYIFLYPWDLNADKAFASLIWDGSIFAYMFHRKRASSNTVSPTEHSCRGFHLAWASLLNNPLELMSLFTQSRPTTPSAAASTAAVQAFLASKTSNTQLSNAAAAAALRSYTTTPTPISDIQTKRMVLRHGSVSSTGSANARPPELQRKTSSGSMTERTFREPSPSRGNSSTLQLEDAPPVPALPRQYASPPPLPVKSIRRPASVEPPERISSPNPHLGGRGVSLDRGPGMMSLRPDRRSKQQVTRIDTSDESSRSQNRDSVNFSRPMSPPNSTSTSPSNPKSQTFLHNQSGSAALAAAVRAPVTATANHDAENIQYSLQNIANRPVKKNKKVVGKGSAEGSHFSKNARPISASNISDAQHETPAHGQGMSPLDPNLENSEEKEAQFLRRKKKLSTSQTYDHPRSSYGSDSETQSEYGSSPEAPRTYNTRAARLLAKQPSVVREDRVAEEKAERNSSRTSVKATTQNGSAAKSSKPTSSRASEPYQEHSRSVIETVKSSVPSSATSVIVPPRSSSTNTGETPKETPSDTQQPLSPARAAHFSSQLVLQTPDLVKHQPPARSVSPAKSALKQSPSSRGPSPLGALPGSWTGRNGRAASEASDTASAISDDGTKVRPQRKSARVSFDEESVLVGRAASPPPSPDSPVIMSPQDIRTDGKWSAAGRNKREDMSDISNVMQPTPTLPSFGSIREKNYQTPTQLFRAQTPPGSSEGLSTRIESSADQVVGHIFAQDFERKGQSANLSTPFGHNAAQVTSVDGRRLQSDTPSDTHASSLRANGSLPALDRPLILDTTSATPSRKETSGSTSAATVPYIAILPATPRVEDDEEAQSGWLNMPGGFPLSMDSLRDGQSSASPIVEHRPTEPTPAQVGIAEPEPQPLASSHEARIPTVGHAAEVFRAQINSQTADEDTDGSIYSDAAEDLSDLEGDGFGSINAIVESPAKDKHNVLKFIGPAGGSGESSGKRMKKANQKKPAALSRNESDLSEPGPEEGWERAQEYWSGLSSDRKAQLERAAARRGSDELLDERKPRVATSKPQARKKALQEKPAQSPTSENPPLPPWPDKQYRKEATKSTALAASGKRQLARNSQPQGPPDVHKQTFVQKGGASALSKPFSRDNTQNPDGFQPRGALRKKARPTSAASMDEFNPPRTGVVVGHGRAASVGPAFKDQFYVAASPPSPKLRRVNSNGSDSSSSFKKARPRATENSRYTMKRSMRAGPADERPLSLQGIRSSATDGRSPSPSGSNVRRPFSSSGPSMRTSLRGSIDADVESRTKSPSRFGFGKASKSQPKKNANPQWSSRFADSSDEDDRRRVRSSSRFADSSDDEDMTPVRGIPRRIDEGDSTELEDSPVETPPRSKLVSNAAKQSEGPNPAGSGESPYQTGLGTVSGNTGSQARIWAEKEKKKRSFFGSLGKKKHDDSRIRKSDLDSPARRDTPLERPKAERGLSNGSLGASPSAGAIAGAASAAGAAVAVSPKSPKLQRRNTPKRFGSDSWPLPETPLKMSAINETDDRPNTSDGNGLGMVLTSGDGGRGNNNHNIGIGNGIGNGADTTTATRPDLGTRRSTEPGEALSRPGTGVNGVSFGSPTTEAGGGGGAAAKANTKKKRFPMLRKAFGLHD